MTHYKVSLLLSHPYVKRQLFSLFHWLAYQTFSSARVYEGQIRKHRVKHCEIDNSISARVVGSDTNTRRLRACPHVPSHPEVNGKRIILPLLTNIETTTAKQEWVNKMAALLVSCATRLLPQTHYFCDGVKNILECLFSLKGTLETV